ncbi:hypothetical protein ACVMH6_000057 [Rhizobium leguminosarum]
MNADRCRTGRTLTVPPEKLDPIGALSAETEDCARARCLLYDRLNERRQSINSTPHVGHSAGQIDPHIPGRPDNAASTHAINDSSILSSMSAGTLKHRPFRSEISMTAGVGGVSGTGVALTSSVISTGRNIAGRPT